MMFSEAERAIFEYDTLQGPVKADPLVLRRNLIRACEGDLWGLIEMAQESGEGEEDDPGRWMQRLNAQERLVVAARVAFGLSDYDTATGQGMTEAMVVAVLNRYLEWLEGNASRGATTPSPSPATDSLPVESSPTLTGSGST